MQSPSGNGDWVVYMSILKEELELIEREAGHVFRPLTLGCLDEFEEETLISEYLYMVTAESASN
ncbi:hypothetical protein CFP56_021003 [Quercus suber]|uniref:Uncharacterized protein n=1 Tax=Quercus suber TaxID=58331 RepID=A0AAW0LYV8_QUESU